MKMYLVSAAHYKVRHRGLLLYLLHPKSQPEEEKVEKV